MKMILSAFFVVLTVVSTCPLVRAGATGDYWMDLGTLYGIEKGIVAYKEICDTRFPSLGSANARAYTDWRKRNESILQRIQKTYLASVWKDSKDEKEYIKKLAVMSDSLARMTQGFRDHFLAQSSQEIETQCRLFPVYLDSGDTDIEKKYREEIQTVFGKRE